MTPGPTSRALRSDRRSNTRPARITPAVASTAPTAWSGEQGLAPEEHRQDDRQAPVGDDDRADDGQRSQLQRREVRQVGDAREDPDRQAGRDAADRVGPEASRIEHDEHQQHGHADGLGRCQGPQAPHATAGERGADVDHAPRQGRDQAGDQTFGHRRSLSATGVRPARCRVLHFPTGQPAVPDPFPWGCSSAGRAPRSHRGGQGFESPHLHHRRLLTRVVRAAPGMVRSSIARTAASSCGSVGQVVSPRVCKTLAFGCGSSILPRPTSTLLGAKPAAAGAGTGPQGPFATRS